VGCIPSKALLNATHKYYEAKKDFGNFGIKFDSLAINFDQLMKQKEDAVTSLTGGIEFLFKKNKVDYLKGWGKFAGQGELEVDLNAGGKEKIKAKNVIIATGSTSNHLPGNTMKVD
jgi:dihydrolipoamide dehydrogenase